VSYILDALKRSEQEEKNRQLPALDSVHVFSRPRPVTSGLIVLLLVSLLVVTGAALYFFMQSNQLVDTVSSLDLDNKDKESEAPEPAAPVVSNSLLINPKPIATKNGITRDPDIVPLRISQLPSDIQRKIPQMRFSSHIFAEDPTLRLVNINGKNISEGETVEDDLLLLEISEEGVVFLFLSYTFEMSVLRDWTVD
jgi:hypothetical protein